MLLPTEERDIKHRRLKLWEVLKPKASDLVLLIFSIAPHILFFMNAIFAKQFHVFITNKSSFLNALMAKSLYKKEILNDFENYVKKNNLAFYSSYPLYPLIFKLFGVSCLGNWKLATICVIMTLSIICNYVFSRFLICTRLVKSTFIPSLIFCVYPMRSLFLRSVTNEYTLFVLVFCLLYIGHQTRSFKLVAVSSFLLIITNENGLFVILSLFILTIFLKNRKEFRAILNGLLCGIIFMAIFHYKLSGNMFPWYRDAIRSRRFPFKELLDEAKTISRLRQFHGLYGYYIITLFACLMLISSDKSLGIPLLVGFINASSFKNRIAMDYSCPFEAIATIVGFDILIKHPRFRTALFVLGPAYILASFYLNSNIFRGYNEFQSNQSRLYML